MDLDPAGVSHSWLCTGPPWVPRGELSWGHPRPSTWGAFPVLLRPPGQGPVPTAGPLLGAEALVRGSSLSPVPFLMLFLFIYLNPPNSCFIEIHPSQALIKITLSI